MSSVRALANLFCSKCDEVCMHRDNRCIECQTLSTSSGNPPVPRPRQHFNNQPGKHFSQAKADANHERRAEAHTARRRAREARARLLSTRGPE